MTAGFVKQSLKYISSGNIKTLKTFFPILLVPIKNCVVQRVFEFQQSIFAENTHMGAIVYYFELFQKQSSLYLQKTLIWEPIMNIYYLELFQKQKLILTMVKGE